MFNSLTRLAHTRDLFLFLVFVFIFVCLHRADFLYSSGNSVFDRDPIFKEASRGVARIFQRGGHTVSNIIVMAFSPWNIAGFLLKKRLTKGGGGSRAPQDPPRYALGF